MLGGRPESENAIALASVVATKVHGPLEPAARSILKPLSLDEVSIQERFIWDAENAVATRLKGAVGEMALKRSSLMLVKSGSDNDGTSPDGVFDSII